MQYEIKPSGHNDKRKRSLDRDQAIQRIKCFMRHRDNSEKAGASFYDDSSTEDFSVKACKTLTMTKTFTPPDRVLADSADAGYDIADARHNDQRSISVY